MSQIEDAMDGLMTAIRNSEEFIRYQAIPRAYARLPFPECNRRKHREEVFCGAEPVSPPLPGSMSGASRTCFPD